MLRQKVFSCVLLWTLGVIVLSQYNAHSQNPTFSRFSEEEGLPSNDVYDVLVADDGLMWFATDNGVSRYDGNEFVNFSVSNGLPANSVLKLYQDQSGKIWFLSYNGMLSYYDQDEILQYTFNDSIVEYFHDNYFNKIYVDSTGGLLLSPRHGGSGYIKKDGQLYSDDELRPSHIDTCYLSFEDKGDDYFLTILSKKPDKCIKHGQLFFADSTYFIPVEFTPRQFQRNFIEIGKDEYMVSYRNCVYYIKDQWIKANRYFNEEVLSLYRDDQERLWVSVKYDHGIYMFEDYSMSGSGTHFLDGYTITSTTQDQEGDYWLGTEGNGVFFLPSFDFKLYKLPGDDRNLNVMALAVSGNRMWFTSRDKHLYTGRVSDGAISDIRMIDIGEPYDWIKHICVDSEGFLWLSSTEYLRYDPAGIPRPTDTVINSTFLSKGLGDTVIVASRRLGIYKQDKLLELVDPDSSRRVYSAYHDRDKGIWLGTLYGVYLYKDGIAYYKGELSPVLRERISCISKVKDMLVFGTSAHGLIMVRGDSVTSHITEENGLIGNSIKSIFPQNDSIIWVGTKDGLNKIILQPGYNEWEIESYGQNDGLPSSEVSSIVMHDEYIWLATGSGLVSFHPDNLKPHLSPPRIQIKNIQINGRDTCLHAQYSLAHDQNDLRISFSGITYRSEEGLRYRYMLSNYNDEIVETKNQWAIFPNLPPGDYTFFVNVGNIHGVWNESPQTIQFHIRKHFTQTVWFIILMIIISSTAVFLITMFFQKQKKIKENARNELVRMEQKLFRLQMNPHFVFNALLAIQGFMYLNKSKEAGRYLTSFAKLIRHTLYGSSEEYISLDKEIEALQYYLELQRLRFNESFDYIIDLDEDLIPESTQIPPLLIQPFLENAIEHGLQHKEDPGKLILKMSMQEDCLMVEVEDNGIGREQAELLQKKKGKLHKSMGLEIIRKRVESLNKIMSKKILLEIIDLHKNEKAAGTLVKICIPYKNT